LPRRFRLTLALLVLATALFSRGASAVDDPKLLWKSIETTHFRITYYSTEDDVAARVATLAEAIYARLSPAVGWSPAEKTDVLLTDQTDSANGFAVAVPFNAVRLFVTAPDDMSPLGDVDDWYLELLTHEYTHILQMDHISGLPALVNRVTGKTLAPNELLPHWLLEGLAVFEESAKTSGGRLRSSMWNMWMRADVLEDNTAPLDVFSNIPKRWPQQNIWYLYGSFFLKWIAETYGEQAIRAMIDDYGRQIVPYAVNRSIRRVTGRTFEELYPAWIDSLRRVFGEQAAAVRARGLREGLRLTHTGNVCGRPRWLPASAWPEHAGDLGISVDDRNTTPGIWALPLARAADGRIVGGREDRRELLIRTNGVSGASFLPDGTAVFHSSDVHANTFFFDDLFELPAHAKSPAGLEGNRVRWSDGWRAVDPAVSPDGRRVAFVTNHRGTTYLMLADVVPSPDGNGHAVVNPRPIVRSAAFDQAFTPRWSPDNRHVAYGSWERGGYRDVRVADTLDGSTVNITRDRAVDGDPVYSPDGRRLYFHSDRTGIANVYAYELATGELRQVTNVVNGAYQPEPSPDGKWLAYVGYTHAGYDVFVMPIDESQWLAPLPYEETRPSPPAEPPLARVAPRPYDPWPTLQMRQYSVQITQGLFGESSTITATGSDIAGHHALTLNLTTEWEHPELEGAVEYRYKRLPFDLVVTASRMISPQTTSFGGKSVPWIRESTGAATALQYAMPRAFDGQTFSLAYSYTRIGAELAQPVGQLDPYDPYDTPSVPSRGFLGALQLGWFYSNAIGYPDGVSNEAGYAASASVDLASPALASDFTGFAATADLTTYWSMPWLRHHALALHLGAGMSGGDLGGVFSVGGFTNKPLAGILQNNFVQGAVALRGYPFPVETGNYSALFNAEYRFPIVNVDRGPSTLPFFLHRVSGAAFVDYGSAFDDPRTAQFKTGVGGELWFDAILAYVVPFTFRIGQAKGLASNGLDKTYFVAAAPF
jgi:Tol biopolymer transport system component